MIACIKGVTLLPCDLCYAFKDEFDVLRQFIVFSACHTRSGEAICLAHSGEHKGLSRDRVYGDAQACPKSLAARYSAQMKICLNVSFAQRRFASDL